MPKVRFEPDGIEIEVPVGTSILEASNKAHAQVGSACGGVCACSTCHVYVKQGLDALSDAQDREEDIMDKAFDVKATSRLGCQSKIESDDDHRRRDQPREPPGVPRRAPRDPRGAEGGRGRRLALDARLPRLDILLARNLGWSRAAAREAVADGRVAIAGAGARDPRRRGRRGRLPLAATVDDEPVAAVRRRARPAEQADRLRDRAARPAPPDGVRAAARARRCTPSCARSAAWTPTRSGLLLWTTDGAEIQRLTHPKRAVPRTYQAALARPTGRCPADLVLDDGTSRASTI